jgi:hypothetical protein
VKPSIEVATALGNVLQRELGTGYDVLVEPVIDSIQGIRIAGRPSFVVFDRARGATTMVQVSGSCLAHDLPMAAAGWTLRVRDQNQGLNPRMVLVSTSRVDQMIRAALAREGVEIIVTDEPAEAVSRVTSLVRAMA